MIYPRPHQAEFAIDAPDSEIKPFSAWARGLGIAWDETNGYPEMEGLNGLFQAITKYIKYLEQNGLSEWSAEVDYPQGAGCRVGLDWYRAKIRNTNKVPSLSQNEWEKLEINKPDVVVNIPNATQTTAGVVKFATSAQIANKSNVSVVVNPSNVATIAQSTDLGIGQSWQNMTISRVSGTTYTNNTGKPIVVNVYTVESSKYLKSISFYVGSVRVGYLDTESNDDSTISVVVPNGASYRIVLSGYTFGTNAFCSELR